MRIYTTSQAAIGLRSIYYGGDERSESEIVWKWLIEHSGVEGAASDNAAVVAVYGVVGVQRTGMEPGINLIQMSDGTVRKVIISK